jgi:hypothetical protein
MMFPEDFEAPEDIARDLLRLGLLFTAESGDRRIMFRAYSDARQHAPTPLRLLSPHERDEIRCLIMPQPTS